MCNPSIISVHSLNINSSYDEEELFFMKLERDDDRGSQQDPKIIMGDLNAEIGREKVLTPTVGNCSEPTS